MFTVFIFSVGLEKSIINNYASNDFLLPYSCFASKKREDIAQMVRDEVKGTFNIYLYSIKYLIYMFALRISTVKQFYHYIF